MTSAHATDPAALQRISSLYAGTLSPDAATRTHSTSQLRAFEAMPGSSLVTLTIVSSHTAYPLETRLAAAIAFKNLVMQHWDEDPVAASASSSAAAPSRLSASDRDTIKAHLPLLMLSSVPVIQAQLSQVLALICHYDFPAKWESLLPDLVSKLNASTPAMPTGLVIDDDAHHQLIVGTLETLHSIFFRYRHEMSTPALLKEIKYVLDHFAAPLTSLFVRTMEAMPALAASNQNAAPLQRLFKRLQLQLELFFTLNFIDLPEFFEDHMASWFKPFQTLMSFQSTMLEPTGSTPGILDECQSLICEICNLYASKYEEEFQPYVASFVQLTWQRLTALGIAERFDSLVTTAIKLLTSVVSKPFNKPLFEQESALSAMVTQIVIPQIHLRESDVSLFEDDPIEWIRRDIEGSDVDTRRRVTVDFLRALNFAFPDRVVALVSGFVNQLLANYAAAPDKAWIQKDAAIFILLALSSKSSTRSAGITQINEAIDVASFFTSQILPELSDERIASLPILKSDCLKFVAAFRSQLGADHLLQLLPLCSKFLRTDVVVLHTYAAYSVEKLLTVKDASGVLKIPRSSLAPLVLPLLEALVSVLAIDEHNEYAMLATLRVIDLAGDAMRPHAMAVLKQLLPVLNKEVASPSHPQFAHHLLNSLAALIHASLPAKPDANDAMLPLFESTLFPVIQQVLGSEHGIDFASYCFQLLAQLLEHRTQVTPSYEAVFPSLITPAFIEHNAVAPAAVRLVQAFVRAQYLQTAPTQLSPVLGVFQRLHATRRHHVLALQLLGTLFMFASINELKPYLNSIWSLVFAKCQQKPGVVYNGALVVCFSTFVLRFGGEALLQCFDSVQRGIAPSLVQSIILPNISSVPSRGERRYERNIAIVGLSRWLFESNGAWTADAALAALWPHMLVRLILLSHVAGGAESGTRNGTSDDTDEAETVDFSGADSFIRLSYAVAPSSDWSISVAPDALAYFVTQLRSWSAAHPNQLMESMRKCNVDEAQQQTLGKFFLAHQLA